MTRLTHLATALSLALALSLGAMGLAGCSSDAANDTEAPTAETTADTELEEEDKDKATPEVEAEADTDAAEDAGADSISADTQHVGEEGIGFVDIPASWKPFEDADGGDDLQWCDGTPYTIVTLNVIELDDEDRESLTLETAANNIAAHLIEEGMDEESLSGAHVTLAGRDAVQVYGIYPEGSVLVVWLLEDDEGNYRYVSAEGTTETVIDSVGIVESSYAL